MEQKRAPSWGIAILLLFLCFPVGIFLIVKKMSIEKYYYVKNGRVLKNLGWGLLFLAFIYISLGISGAFQTEDGRNVGVAFVVFAISIFGVGGAVSLIKGQSYVKRGLLYNRYVSIINAQNSLLIDNIAAAIPTSYDQAVNDLKNMIEIGYFSNAYIDLNRRELIMPESFRKEASVKTDYNIQFSTEKPSEEQPRSKKCPNCGATNPIVPGAANECEYCGSPL